MTNPPDETRLKELIKSAVIEVLDERHPRKWRATIRTIAIWALILVAAIDIYNISMRFG